MTSGKSFLSRVSGYIVARRVGWTSLCFSAKRVLGSNRKYTIHGCFSFLENLEIIYFCIKIAITELWTRQ